MIAMNIRYDDVLDPRRQAYDNRAGWRDGLTKEPWKLVERQAFRDRLAPGARRLEVGAGTGAGDRDRDRRRRVVRRHRLDRAVRAEP
ncbi:hypothetical protein AB0C31_33180, partial [Actinoplanes philippinensis]